VLRASLADAGDTGAHAHSPCLVSAGSGERVRGTFLAGKEVVLHFDQVEIQLPPKQWSWSHHFLMDSSIDCVPGPMWIDTHA